MAKRFTNSRIAAAVAAALGLGLSAAANAVVVVGGDNGWEVSFDGNINAFYVISDNDEGWNNLGLNAPTGPNSFAGGAPQEDIQRVTSGFLPAFFSFNVKSPTVNGLTATGRFSFAPTINNSTTKNQLYAGDPVSGNGINGIQGASVDTREVVVNVDAAWGTVSFGRTLSIFGRQAILNDMTLFGVGMANQDGAAVTAGRIGRGYTYPNFNARFSYKTPVFAGLQAEVGLYDPSVENLGAVRQGDSVLNQTDTPRVEGELTYTATLGDATVKAWFDGLWQNIETAGKNTFVSNSVDVHGWGSGATAGFMGFNVTGYYYEGAGLGRSLQFTGGTACDARPAAGLAGTLTCEAADNDGYYVQGTYTFFGKTKVGGSYGESNQSKFDNATLVTPFNQDVSLSMWTVGVYHDVNSWLKLIAEYSNGKNTFKANAATGAFAGETESQTVSFGTFFMW